MMCFLQLSAKRVTFVRSHFNAKCQDRKLNVKFKPQGEHWYDPSRFVDACAH